MSLTSCEKTKTNTYELVVSVGAGAVVYVVALILMRTREMGELIVGIANALSRKKAPSQPAS